MAVHFTTAEQNPNLIACCKISHDTIGDCLGKVFDMFKVIGTTQLPLANVVNSSQSFNDRKQKCQDTIQTLAKLIRKVKLLYDKIEEETKNMYPLSLQNLPYSADFEKMEHKKQEKDGLIQLVKKRNEDLKKIIDLERSFIWEVNSMMNARKNL